MFYKYHYSHLSETLKSNSSKPHIEEIKDKQLIAAAAENQALRYDLQDIQKTSPTFHTTFIPHKGRLEILVWRTNLTRHLHFNYLKDHND